MFLMSIISGSERQKLNIVVPSINAAIQVEWQDDSEEENSFEVQSQLNGTGSWTTKATFGPSEGIGETRTEIITGFETNTYYKIRVLAKNDTGDFIINSPADVYTEPTETLQNLSATVISNNTVELFWDSPAEEPINGGYEVRYSIDGGLSWNEYEVIFETGSTSGLINDLGPEQDHAFEIRAININDEGYAYSPWSNTTFARTLDASYLEWELEFVGGVVGHYQMEDPVGSTICVDTGGSFNGTYGGSTLVFEKEGLPGVPDGKAVGFNNSGDTVSIPFSHLGEITKDSQFTISAWVKAPTPLAGKRILSVGSSSSTAKGPSIRFGITNPSYPVFHLQDETSNILVNYEPTEAEMDGMSLSDGDWHKVTMIFDKARVIGMMDGVVLLDTQLDPLIIGTIIIGRTRISGQAHGSLGSTWIRGDITQVTIRPTTAVTPEQELKSYNKGVLPHL